MRFNRCLLLAACLTLALPCFAQKESWLPVTPQDLQIKEVPGNPGASAIQLYYADYVDDNNQDEFFYQRIKVLTEKGKEHANVELEVAPEWRLTDLKARTIHPDGQIIDFSGKPFEKTIIKGRGFKVVAKTFTMPDVTVGSIIEYKYRMNAPEGQIIGDTFWVLQHQLYTVKEHFSMKMYTGALQGFPDGFQLSASWSHMPNSVKPEQKKSGYELELENMAGLEAEEYMPPEQTYKPVVHFFYIGSRITDGDKFWQDVGHDWNDEIEHFVGNHREIKEEAERVIGTETDPEKKLRKLYERVQQVRNLSFERERSITEAKKENLKGNQHVADVLARGVGNRRDITRLYVALARAAGFEAAAIPVSNRKDRVFEKTVLSRGQFETEIALVKLNGKDIYLEPGTRFSPFGMLRWPHTSTMAMRPDKKVSSLFQVPGAAQDKAVTRRTAAMSLSEDGALKGEVTLQFTGAEALEHRLDALESDEAGRKKDVEEELQRSLANGAIVKMIDATGWQGSEEPLVVRFNVEIPNYASAVGKRLLLPAYLFQVKQMDAFKHAERKYPIYFSYAFSEGDKVTIKLPDGYKLENVPPRQEVKLPYALYQNLSQFDGTNLVTQRVLLMGGIYFDLSHYQELKGFFNQVQAGDEQQAVLQNGGQTNAQKGN